MSRTLWIAAGALVVVVLAWFAVVDTDESIVTSGTQTIGTDPLEDEAIDRTGEAGVAAVGEDRTLESDMGPTGQTELSGEVVEENTSNRVASDVATDDAYESALEGEEPVQETLETSRSVASTTGAVGAADFTSEGFDRETVLLAIETSDLEEMDKEHLMELLAEAEANTEDLDAALASIRAALEIEN